MNEITRLVEGLEASQKSALAQAAEQPVVVEPVASIEAAPVEVAPVEAASAETEPVVSETAAVSEKAEVGAVETALATEEETEPTFDALFALKPDMVPAVVETEEEETDDKSQTGKKKKKKVKSVEITYDPDRDLLLTKKKHKRGEPGWDWEE
jgi:N utilization substance protein A